MADTARSIADAGKVVKYDITWKGDLLGYVDDVDPTALKEKWLQMKIGEIGDIVLDELFQGLEGTIKMKIRQVTTANLKKLKPFAAATGSYALHPTTPFASAYSQSGLLVCHPKGVVGTTDDMSYLHAFPIVTLPKGNQQNDEFHTLDVEWKLYPDQTAITASTPTIVYGYRGAPPT